MHRDHKTSTNTANPCTLMTTMGLLAILVGVLWPVSVNAADYIVLDYGYSTAVNPADATSYYIHPLVSSGLVTACSSTSGSQYWGPKVPKSGVLKSIRGIAGVGGTLPTTENNSFYLTVNSVDVRTLTTTLPFSATVRSNYIEFTNLNINVNEGDTLCIRWTTPTYATNPTNVIMHFWLLIDTEPSIATSTPEQVQDNVAYGFFLMLGVMFFIVWSFKKRS